MYRKTGKTGASYKLQPMAYKATAVTTQTDKPLETESSGNVDLDDDEDKWSFVIDEKTIALKIKISKSSVARLDKSSSHEFSSLPKFTITAIIMSYMGFDDEVHEVLQ